jgi:signal transduction histidine kinase
MNDADTYRLLSNFTHQVINPLNGVIGTLDNIVDGTISKENIVQRVNSARGQLECTTGLVRNLAYFAEFSAGNEKAPLKNDKICVIPQLLIEAAQFYQEQAKVNKIRIELDDKSFQLAVRGNPDLLRQVFMNIFDNAVKYGEHNSLVNIKYWHKKNPEQIIITISGKSVGFSKAERIFDLGVRGRAACARTSSGSGIGLSICGLIINNVFKGSIIGECARSTNISTFTIRLKGGFDNAK